MPNNKSEISQSEQKKVDRKLALGRALNTAKNNWFVRKLKYILSTPYRTFSPLIREDMPPLVRREAGMLPLYRWLSKVIKNSWLVEKLRHSRLNPYHTFLTNIKADSYEEAKEKAYAMGKVQFLYNGTRYYSERHDCSANEEHKKYNKLLRGRGDVSDRVPRNEKGELDLFAEDPIIIAIMPIEGPSLYGHVGMQYKDRVVNRLISTIYTDPVYDTYKKYTEYYAIYPSKIGLDPKKIVREIDKHNIRYGYQEFSLGFNNCSKNVAKVLEKLGVKDIDLLGPDKLGIRFATPGNNPFGFGIKDWCFRNGVHVYPEEVEKMTARYPITDNEKRRDEQEEIRLRYKAVTKAKVRTRKEAEEEKKARQAKKTQKNQKSEQITSQSRKKYSDSIEK